MRKHTRFLYLLAGVILIGAGAIVGVVGNNAGNPIIIVLGFFGLAG